MKEPCPERITTNHLEANGVHLWFYEPFDAEMCRTGDGHVCTIREFDVNGRGATREGAIEDLIQKLQGEVVRLHRVLPHRISLEERRRRRLLLGRIDMIRSGLLRGVEEGTWVFGFLEHGPNGDLKFHAVGAREDVYPLTRELGVSTRFEEGYRLARVRAGQAGEPVGPVDQLEPVLDGDTEAVARELRRRMGAEDG